MFESLKNRRQWFHTAASATAALWCRGLQAADLAAASGPAGSRGEAAGPRVKLVADPTQHLHRVRVEMEIEGNINVPNNALVSKERAAQIPVRSRSVLDWEERVAGYAADRTAVAAERYYHEARSSGQVGRNAHSLQLRDEAKAVRVQHDDRAWVIYSMDAYLSGQELDLVKGPTSSLAVDALLPTTAVAVGDRYEPQREVLAKWLSLAAVQANTVRGEVMAIEETLVRLQLTGKVEGSVAGVPTTIDLVAKLVFDRELATCTWVAVAIRETREIGRSEPGFEVAGTIRMIRKPLEGPVKLPAEASADWLGMIPTDRLYSELTSTAVGYSVLMDRRWKIMTDVAGSSMMRMIEEDRGIAQCDLRPLGKLAPGVQLTLEALVEESKVSMGERFVEVLHAREEVNSLGLRVLRVTIQGAVEGVPVQWVFIHFSDDSGRRLLATMTLSNDHHETFAGADEQLSGSLRFLPLEDETLGVAANRMTADNVK